MVNRPGYNVEFNQINDNQINIDILASTTNVNYRIYVDGLNLKIAVNDPRTIEAKPGNNGEILIKCDHIINIALM